MGGHRVPLYKWNQGDFKNWLTAIGKKQPIYELSEVEAALLAYDAAEGPVFDFIVGAPREGLLINMG